MSDLSGAGGTFPSPPSPPLISRQLDSTSPLSPALSHSPPFNYHEQQNTNVIPHPSDKGPTILETKIIYHLDDQSTPYLVKLPIPPDTITLGDLKKYIPPNSNNIGNSATNNSNNSENEFGDYKYFFKSMDDDFGVVKEEIVEDKTRLPSFNGRVICWIVQAGLGGPNSHDGSGHSGKSAGSDNREMGRRRYLAHNEKSSSTIISSSTCTSGLARGFNNKHPINKAGFSQYPHQHRRKKCYLRGAGPEARHAAREYHSYTTHSSSNSTLPPAPYHHSHPTHDHTHPSFILGNIHNRQNNNNPYGFSDTEDSASRFSSVTDAAARQSYKAHSRRVADADTDITESVVSVDVIEVTLDVEATNFLGISIVGRRDKNGDGGFENVNIPGGAPGISVGSIMKGGAISRDGRIEPGDVILEVNGTSLDRVSSDQAIAILRDAVKKPGKPVKLLVAKMWGSCSASRFRHPDPPPPRYYSAAAERDIISGRGLIESDKGYGGGEMIADKLGDIRIDGRTNNGRRDFDIPDCAASISPCVLPPFPPHHHNDAASACTSNSFSATSNHHHAPSSYNHNINQHHNPNLPLLPSASYNHNPSCANVNNIMIKQDRADRWLHSLVETMCVPDSGLDIRDRNWLKLTIKNAFLGSDLVDWLAARGYRLDEGDIYKRIGSGETINNDLHSTSSGASSGSSGNRKQEAKKLASYLLKKGLIKHSLSKNSFSEQCYYVINIK